MKSVEQRLYEAWRNNRGCRLSKADIDSLISDDAIATRISNEAAIDRGCEQPGADCISGCGETWLQFGERLESGE